MQSLQNVVHQWPVMSIEEFLHRVAWTGVQPSPSGGGEASATQEPQPVQEDASTNISEPSPLEPFIFEDDSIISSQAEPSTPVPNLPISQDPPSAPALDLNEHAEDHS